MTTEPRARSICPTVDDAWRLVGHYLHKLSHDEPRHWQQVDAEAAQCRQKLLTLLVEQGQDVRVALWLHLSDTEVECSDPGCAAREKYLTSDGSGRLPASGPLPDLARGGCGPAYFEYTVHPHGDQGWAASVDPRSVEWMTTALALYGGVLRVDWMWFRTEGDAVGAGHTIWEIHDHEVTEVQRLSTVSTEDDGPKTAKSGDPAYRTPPLPPEVQARLDNAVYNIGG
ncbi:hypothetical protein SAMN05216371_8240 [Streptomyces sp. TLI_053]|uniref:hypothetical protein n=1 Tax=Streptomyces sp. TLI_053 TaxID=1855352 RepID=UPI0008792342|nr:hypothetical protein [Streptomyces sp. TLI_053]SDT83413.1 hypothetical protein SAMN05216371_8240 [Streptomyces sp. TLI_053]